MDRVTMRFIIAAELMPYYLEDITRLSDQQEEKLAWKRRAELAAAAAQTAADILIERLDSTKEIGK